MKEVEAKVRVNKMFKKSGKLVKESDEVETVFVTRIDPEAAYVTVSTDRKSTVNLGDYNSASFSVFCSTPCPQDEEQMEAAYKWVADFCEEKLTAIMKEVKG